MLKAVYLAFLLIVGISFAAPSIIDYRLSTADGFETNSTLIFISQLSSIGIRDGVHFDITANETVNWSLAAVSYTHLTLPTTPYV